MQNAFPYLWPNPFHDYCVIRDTVQPRKWKKSEKKFSFPSPHVSRPVANFRVCKSYCGPARTSNFSMNVLLFRALPWVLRTTQSFRKFNLFPLALPKPNMYHCSEFSIFPKFYFLSGFFHFFIILPGGSWHIFYFLACYCVANGRVCKGGLTHVSILEILFFFRFWKWDKNLCLKLISRGFLQTVLEIYEVSFFLMRS